MTESSIPRKGILYRTVVAVVGATIVVGALFIGAATAINHDRAQRVVAERLGELLDTVESTVSAACFVQDQALAQDIVRGLLKNREVFAVTILSGGQELASERRGARSSAHTGHIEHKVYSPFTPGDAVGLIRLEPNPAEIQRFVDREVRVAGMVLATMLIGVMVAIIVVLSRQVVQPIKRISDSLHHMDAVAGERVPVPVGFAENEVGRLVQDINTLADRLVDSLDDERLLRIQREMDEKKYRAIFDNAETGIFIADRAGNIESGNPALVRMFGLPHGVAVGRLNLVTLDWRSPEQVVMLVEGCHGRAEMLADDLEYLVSDGSLRWLNMAVSSVGEGWVQGIVSDVTERKRAEEEARLKAVTDPLTGAANRPSFQATLAATISASAKANNSFGMMLVNLDGFRRVNDALGLPVGDKVLADAAGRLRTCIGQTDTVARLGGDEFALLLPGSGTVQEVFAMGERVLLALAREYDVHSAPIHLSASIGIVLFPSDGTDEPTLLRNAELALDRARKSGGNRFSLFDPALAEAAERRRTLEVDMQLGLRHNQFELFYQPIIDLVDNRLAGAEALIRWRHPVQGLVPPDVFIPLAEETGFIVDIGLWTLDAACAQLALWQSEGLNRYVSLNISGRQIPDGLLPETLAETVRRHGIEPWRLVLEITEGVLMSDVGKAQKWLDAVRELGFRIYLDDFGTGYSSLSYLKRFPVSTVKIDKSFVRDMASDGADQALVAAVVAMAKGLHMSVVAEGVETAEQLDLLRSMGCRYGQGYHFSKPVPANEFEAAAERINLGLWTREA